MELKENTILKNGDYRIINTLGQGGFGITYLATQRGLDRTVVIKEFFMSDYCARERDTLRVTFGTDSSREMIERFREKFVKEARNIAAFDHPNIVRVIDVFEENNTAYYVMEYHSAGSLGSLVDNRDALNEDDALYYIRQVASALKYVHSRKMMHLDIKPDNILVNSSGEAVLIDFGLSKRYDEKGKATSTTPIGISHG
ncbi:MAG: serine/threonine protein kinase, partial [Bacteroidaceae bacterium]|nr:serine/threonine protein kinase [Bacteroidaceae bacterium]